MRDARNPPVAIWLRVALSSATLMRSIRFFFALALASTVVACGPGSNNSDAGADAGPPCTDCNDRINIVCTSAGGDEGAAACNTRLMATTTGMIAGAKFFIGDRRSCDPNPNSPMCRPLCELSQMSGTNTGGMNNPAYCEFNAMTTPGCAINRMAGYSVIVELPNGRRATASVTNAGLCPAMGTQNRSWGLVNLDDLRGAATCASETPMGGFEPNNKFVACDQNSDNCTAASQTTCQERMFRAGMQTYMRSFCSRTCMMDAECGTSGRCLNGDCFHRCGGTCGLSCPESFACSNGACIPAPL